MPSCAGETAPQHHPREEGGEGMALVAGAGVCLAGESERLWTQRRAAAFLATGPQCVLSGAW